MKIFFLVLLLFLTQAHAELSANICGSNITEQQLLKKFSPGNPVVSLGTATATVEKRICYSNNICSPWSAADNMSIGFIDRGNDFVTMAPLSSTTVGLFAVLDKNQVLIELNFPLPGRIDLEDGLSIGLNQALSSRSFLHTNLRFPSASGSATLYTGHRGSSSLLSFLIGGVDGWAANAISRASFEFKGSLSQSGCLFLQATSSATSAWNAPSFTEFRGTIKGDNIFAP